MSQSDKDRLVAPPRRFDREKAISAAAALLDAIGAEVNDPSMIDTPRRMVDMLAELTSPEPVDLTTFPGEGYDELVLARDIPFSSLCAHHVLPFTGVAHVAYLPGEQIVGLSKLARIVAFYAHGFQVQERLTVQIAACIEDRLAPRGVGVVLEADHSCVSIRGACATGSSTVTSAVRGAVRSSEKLRSEFFALVGRHRSS